MCIGGRNGSSGVFYGKICEASIYHRALTPEEITKHYSAAVGNPSINLSVHQIVLKECFDGC